LLLATVVADKSQSPGVRVAALETLNKLNVAGLADIAAIAAASDVPELRIAALPVSSRLNPDAAVAQLEFLVNSGSPAEQQTAFRTLGDLKDPRADDLLLGQLGRLAAGEVAPAAQLDLLDAAANRDDARIKDALAARDAALVQNPDPLAPFRVALEGGDARKAFQIIYRDPVMQCIRCHRVGEWGSSDVGPDLGGIGSRVSREYLLESIIKPSAKIAAGFELVVVTKTNDEAVVGTLLNRDDSGVRLKTPDGEEVAIAAAEVKSVESAPSAMPEIAAIALTKAQIRDVIAGLAALTETGDSENAGAAGKASMRALRGVEAR
jgi:quinoprotein glucose dehydrogenase